MIDDDRIIEHLREGGEELYDRAEPPRIDLDAITGARAAAPTHRTLRLRPMVAVAGAAGCLAAGVAVGGVIFGGATTPSTTTVASTKPTTTTPPRTRHVTLARFDDAAPQTASADVSVFTATDGRTVDLRVRGLQQPRKGEFYELWVLGEGTRMISLGIVRVNADGSANVRMPLPVSLRRFPVFDLSLEPGDGNPGHSGQSILRSAAAA